MPCCDTFMDTPYKGGIKGIGSVGACKITDCRHNQSLKCNAGNIEIARKSCNADCITFEGCEITRNEGC